MRPEDKLEGQAIQTATTGAETIRDEDKIHLVLSYLGILALIPLLTVKDSEYVKWHARNGLVLGLGGGITLFILNIILGFIPILGWLIGCVLAIGLLVVDVLAMVKALNGVRYRVPVVTDLAEKL